MDLTAMKATELNARGLRRVLTVLRSTQTEHSCHDNYRTECMRELLRVLVVLPTEEAEHPPS